VEDAYPRRYSPSPLQNLRQGIKQSLLFALLAIRLHYLYTHTQRLSTVAMCKASASLGSESGESAIMTVVSLICARVSVEISDFAPRADKVRRARRFASPRAAKLGIGPPADFAGRANGSLPPSSRKGEALSGIVTDRSACFFAIPARASLGRDDDPLARLAKFA